MSDIFISYRRKTSIDRAIRLKEQLSKRGYDVYLDTEMGAGNFDEILINEIRECTYVLLLLTDNSFDRCRDEKDVFRMEIECARYTGKTIIPILNPGYHFPEEMPESIKFLKYCNGVEIAPHLLDSSVDDLVKRMLHTSAPSNKIAMQSGQVSTEIMQEPGSRSNIIHTPIICPHCGSKSVHSIQLFEGGQWDYWFSEKKRRKKNAKWWDHRILYIGSFIFGIISFSLAIIGMFFLYCAIGFGIIESLKGTGFEWLGYFCAIILVAAFIVSMAVGSNLEDKTKNLYKTASIIRNAIRYGEYQLWEIKCAGCKEDFSILFPKSEDIRERIHTMKSPK